MLVFSYYLIQILIIWLWLLKRARACHIEQATVVQGRNRDPAGCVLRSWQRAVLRL